MVRAVIFDLDGVLTDTAEHHFLAWTHLAEAEGLAFDRDLNEQLRGRSRRASLELILGDRRLDEPTMTALMERKNARYVQLLQQLGPDDVLPGARALVQDARRRGWGVAVGSASRNARFVLDRLGLTPLFDVVVDGTVPGRAKPAPDVFLAAAAALGVDPAEVVVIEDATSGVDAALAAGMQVIGVGPPQRVGHAHHRVDRTDQVDLDVVERRS